MSFVHDRDQYVRKLSRIQGTGFQTYGSGAYGHLFVPVTSIEGYNHALVITYSCSKHRWQYDIETKDEVLGMSKRWMAETA